MSAIPFSMLGSSGATQSQVSEFQPYPQELLTKYYMFGYQFDPSSWLPIRQEGEKSIYNPINDMLNPLNMAPDEVLQTQSMAYIEEQMLRQKWQSVLEKRAFLKQVPASVRDDVELLYDRGLFTENTTQTNLDTVLQNLIQRGELGDIDAGRLRNLFAQKTTWMGLLNRARQERNQGDLEGLLQANRDLNRSAGLNERMSEALAIQAVSRAVDRVPLLSRTYNRDIWAESMDANLELQRGAEENVGEGVRQQQFQAEVRRFGEENTVLDPVQSSLGSRLSGAPITTGVASGYSTTGNVDTRPRRPLPPLAEMLGMASPEERALEFRRERVSREALEAYDEALRTPGGGARIIDPRVRTRAEVLASEMALPPGTPSLVEARRDPLTQIRIGSYSFRPEMRDPEERRFLEENYGAGTTFTSIPVELESTRRAERLSERTRQGARRTAEVVATRSSQSFAEQVAEEARRRRRRA